MIWLEERGAHTLTHRTEAAMLDLSRRDFARLLAFTGSAALFPERALAAAAPLRELGLTDAPLPPTPREPDEKFWHDVRSRFLLPRDLGFMNAANLCPTSLPVVDALDRSARLYEAGPTPEARTVLMKEREETRRLLAEMFRVTPEEIVITRNTSEGNNFISSGLDLKSGDEIIVFSDNHPSNLRAWVDKGKRFGFNVVSVPHANPHPGTEYYVDAFKKLITPKTKLIALTHVSSNSGDVFPAAEVCAMARDHGVLSLLDGAQSFGVLDVDLSVIKPDFYTGSAHKWPCGPKEVGVLFVAKPVQDRVSPTVIGLYQGAVGISQKLEGTGQRDDAKLATFAEALKFRNQIGRDVSDRRARALAQRLISEVGKLDGVKMWTHRDPAKSGAIVIFKPGALDPRKLNAALTEKDRFVVTARAGEDRPGLRLSPHFYNTMDEVDRFVGVLRGYLRTGV
jgi:selenocysteine lyase/cysteine desulfurase